MVSGIVTSRATTNILLESILWSVLVIFFSNIIFFYFVFNHNFGGGVPVELGADGYFDFSKSLTSLGRFFAFIIGVVFLFWLALFFVISRKSLKPTFGMPLFLLMLSCSACALINYTGVYDGLYEFGHIFRAAYDEYSLGNMYAFSWIFTFVVTAMATVLLYFLKFAALLIRSSVSLLGIFRRNKDVIK